MHTLRHRLFKFWKSLEVSFVSNLLPYRYSRVTEERWESEYSSGHWDYLRSLQQTARYHVIAGYCDHFARGGAILDVGCGDGYLQEVLASAGYASYLGIDLSAEAIGNAKSRQDEKTSFRQADVDSLQPDERFDSIVFNESLYYFKKPIPVLKQYASFLTEDGVFIISMHGLRSWNRRLWKMVEAVYPPVDEVTVSHGSGKCWTIKVFAPSGRTRRLSENEQKQILQGETK